MKRITTLLLALVATVSLAFASETTTYNGTLTAKDRLGGIVINATQDNVNVYITKNDDGTYQIDLKNFIVSNQSSTYYIGNITVKSMTASESDGTITIESKAGSSNNIILSDGDDPKDANWMGSSLGGAKGDVTGTITGDKISLSIPVSVTIGLTVTIDVSFSGTAPTTDIKSVAANESESSILYNTAGQQVSPSTKGLVIKGRKKYIMK